MLSDLQHWLFAATAAHAELWYHAFWLAGASLWITTTLLGAGRRGLPRARAAAVLIALVPIAFAGARLHALLGEHAAPPGLVWQHPSLLLSGGYRLPGGLLVAMVSAPLLCRALRVPFAELADCAAPAVGVALATGRVGCFVRGCCAGARTDLPWGLAYGVGSEAHTNHLARGLIAADATAALPVHPLPLYLAAIGIAVSLTIVRLARGRRYPGEAALAMVALLGLGLGFAELFRETEQVVQVPFRTAIPAVVGLLALLALATGRLGARRAATATRVVVTRGLGNEGSPS